MNFGEPKKTRAPASRLEKIVRVQEAIRQGMEIPQIVKYSGCKNVYEVILYLPIGSKLESDAEILCAGSLPKKIKARINMGLKEEWEKPRIAEYANISEGILEAYLNNGHKG